MLTPAQRQVLAAYAAVRRIYDNHRVQTARDKSSLSDRLSLTLVKRTRAHVQAAAVVSGVAALLLQAEPSLTPGDVKCRLMASARAAYAADGSRPAYGILQQGAGLVNAYDAVYSTDTGCANRGPPIETPRPRCSFGASVRPCAGPLL